MNILLTGDSSWEATDGVTYRSSSGENGTGCCCSKMSRSGRDHRQLFVQR